MVLVCPEQHVERHGKALNHVNEESQEGGEQAPLSQGLLFLCGFASKTCLAGKLTIMISSIKTR
jgi:hypothetical protein